MKNACRLLLLIMLLPLAGKLNAIDEIDPLLQEQMMLKAVLAITDSLAQLKEQEILSKYGFTESNTLLEVQDILQIENYQQWKRLLELDAGNTALDKQKLKDLGISAYQARLAYESATLGFNELNTVAEVSTLLKVPLQKFKQLTIKTGDPFDRNIDVQTLQRLNLNPFEVKSICDDYQENRLAHGLSITLIGMLIVFVALMIISLIISQLHRVNWAIRPPVAKIIKVNPQGQITGHPKDLSSGVIIAAITALHLHVNSIEERRRLMLTFKRASINLWHASRVTEMPNYRLFRRGK